MVNLYAWRKHPNFGDMLSGIVVEFLLGEAVQFVEEDHPKKLLALGSILQYAKDGDVVWGTGLHPTCQMSFSNNKNALSITVLAVRGPLSRDALLARGVDCPEVYGDPAILMPLIRPPSERKSGKTILIPHMSEYHSLVDAAKARGLALVDPSGDWRVTIDQITSSSCVISGSLHGLIIAEAYGIPAIWYRATHTEGIMKYQDYYLGTGRIGLPHYSLQAATDATAPRCPEIAIMQNKLITAFLAGFIRDKLA